MECFTLFEFVGIPPTLNGEEIEEAGNARIKGKGLIRTCDNHMRIRHEDEEEDDYVDPYDMERFRKAMMRLNTKEKCHQYYHDIKHWMAMSYTKRQEIISYYLDQYYGRFPRTCVTCPVKRTSVEQIPVKRTSVEQIPDICPVICPVKQSHVKQTSIEQIPDKQTPVEQIPDKQTPVKHKYAVSCRIFRGGPSEIFNKCRAKKESELTALYMLRSFVDYTRLKSPKLV